MDNNLSEIKQQVYDKCGFTMADYILEPESETYAACQFKLNNSKAICRNAKITPKKAGQFVTFWKRKGKGPIEPYHEADGFDYFIVIVKKESTLGQFIFPKSILVKKGIVSTDNREGKRAFRVYPKWDIVKSKQAERTQKWQLNYFYDINEIINLKID